MPAPRCSLDDSAATVAADPLFASGRGGADDGGPKPRTRGSFAGFLPDAIVNDLQASADSGAGLALMDAPETVVSNNAALWLVTLGTLLFLTASRSR